MDSESKHSYIGSFLQPPDKILPAAFAHSESKKLTAVDGERPPILNNQAVVAALKTLQEKIRRLELERSQAEDNLCSLSAEAAQYKKALEHESYKKDISHQELMQQRKGVSMQLNAAQSRCSLLEKQLDYMKKMVSSAELEKKMILEQQTQLQREKNQNRVELHAKLEKLEVLEKQCLKLTATQRIAEDKIKHLEEKLCEEEHQRKLIQEKAAQLQTGFEINRILLSLASSQNELKKKNRKKKKTKKKNPTVKRMYLPQFNVKAGVLPFVAGKEGAASGISGQTVASKSVSSFSTISTATRNLSDLLLAVEDELGQMSFEHQELLRQIQGTHNSEVREDLERELDCLVKKMEIKGEQISKLKKHQANVQKIKQKTQKLKQEAAHVKLKCGDQKETKEIPVAIRESRSKACPGQKSKSSLQLLKNVQKLQWTLKRDDIMWEQ
ncbi:Centrosomal protein CEP57L1 [Struthio camelus australis]|uniref:Centrosomal protein 57kDa-like protein 1 n=1 Tax=Struthio camelus australis TaxID=441894 RepID=A0A093HKZ5_STRCA|nr:Centrosomal protein CEP57L1 [Struthio camelus australis]